MQATFPGPNGEPDWDLMRRARVQDLEPCICHGPYYHRKAERIHALLQKAHADFGEGTSFEALHTWTSEKVRPTPLCRGRVPYCTSCATFPLSLLCGNRVSAFQKADVLERKSAVLYQLCHFPSKRLFARGKVAQLVQYGTFPLHVKVRLTLHLGTPTEGRLRSRHSLGRVTRSGQPR